MEAADLKTSMADLMASFSKQMEAFESRLQLQQPTMTVSKLAADFTSFKMFILTSLRALQDQVARLAHSQDQLQMHSRRKILLIHGVPEEKKEDTAAVVVGVTSSKLKLIDFAARDISRCHRMGRLSSSRPRPILVKLRDISVRDKLWFSKANLRDSGITLSEFLTKCRHELFMQARERFGVSKCWTRDGKVFVGGPDNSRHRISCTADLDQLVSKLQKPKETQDPTPLVVKTSARPAKK